MTEQKVGTVTHWFGRIRVASVKLEGPVRLGDWLRVDHAGRRVWARVKSMQINHKPVEAADAGQEVGIKLPGRAHLGDPVVKVDAKPSLWARLRGR